MNTKPKVSIILPTYNVDQSLIDQTLKSVLKQKYQNWEIIIVDAGDCGVSGDKKIKVIKALPRGISDAFNKGIKAAKGDYLYFIGAGDYFWSDNSIEKVMKGIDVEKDMLICGKINRITEDGEKVLYTSSIDFKKWRLLYKMGLPHQALFTNKKFFDRYGLFDVNCKYAMDYELLLRSYKEFPKVIIKDVIVAAWRAGGIGTNKIDKILDEYHRIRLKNKIAMVFVLNLIYFISKLRYKIWHE